MKFFRFPLLTLLTIGLGLSGFSNPAIAQDFPEIYNSETDETAQPMSAEAAASGFEMPDGLKVNVFASEPAVQNPIAMAWDARGRLWVAENFTYAERSQRFDLSLQDRVLIFEDADHDGVAERRTVFTDQIQMLTSVEVGHGGVWLMCPPQLLFIPDADRDDVPDGPAITMLDGFDVAKDNYHNFANGLKWGPDGWLYGRCGGSCPGRIGVPGTPDAQRVALEGGIWRFHPRTSRFESLCHGTTNPWGHDWNEWGDGFFINTVNGHLWQLIPGAHYDRPFTLDPNPLVYQEMQMHADHWHFDTTGQWHESREGAANEFGGGHAHCGCCIYLGDGLPDEFRGRLMTLNFHGRRMNQELLSRSGSGYVAKHGPDTLIAADPFFRGMEISYGPNGNLFVIDWSDTGECHESTGVHRTSGRIYRVQHQSHSQETFVPLDLHSLTNQALVELTGHPNEWFVRMARLVLSERSQQSDFDSANSYSAANELEKIVRGADANISVRALLTLAAMERADEKLLTELMSHEHESLRAWAVRLLTDHWPLDDVWGPVALDEKTTATVEAESQRALSRFCELAKTDDSGLVRLALASTLQRFPLQQRPKLATALVARAEDADDQNLPLLVWYGLMAVSKKDSSALLPVVTAAKWPLTQRLIARRLAEGIESNPATVESLLEFAINAKDQVRKNVLNGVADGLKGWSKAPQPDNWAAVVAVVEESQSTFPDPPMLELTRELSVVFGDGRALEQVRKIILNQTADIGVRRSALETLVNSNDPAVVEICLPLLSDARINVEALRGVQRSNDPVVAEKLIGAYYQFRSPQRAKVIEVLVSRPSFVPVLLDAIESKKIPSSELTAYDVRQIRTLENAEFDRRVTALWGETRQTSAEKMQQIEALKQQLTVDHLSLANPGAGRVLFETSCAKCHRLFGFGETIGPELTGANRSNLDYLLENIVDPSAVVSKDFRMTVVLTNDGQVFNGLVAATNEKTITLQTQTELKTILLSEIETQKRTNQSPMPDGMLDNLTPTQIRDLISYLMQPAQVPKDK